VSYLPSGMPVPEPGPEDHQFWEACARRELRIQQCAACSHFRHPPAPICPVCRSFQSVWTLVPGTGSVFSYTVAWHPVHPSQRGKPPYNVVLVLLDGAGDVRLISNLIDVHPERLAIGMRVKLRWDEIEGGMLLPLFVSDEKDLASD
jgi:uncharacterized OB-fold protein